MEKYKGRPKKNTENALGKGTDRWEPRQLLRGAAPKTPKKTGETWGALISVRLPVCL